MAERQSVMLCDNASNVVYALSYRCVYLLMLRGIYIVTCAACPCLGTTDEMFATSGAISQTVPVLNKPVNEMNYVD